jgi:glutathione S-transferase
MQELEKRILPTFNRLLDKKLFFCGSELTIFDIQVYSEITSLIALTRQDNLVNKDNLPNLAAWMELF